MPNNRFSPFPTLRTDRLVLRQLSARDAGEIFALRSDEDVNKYIDRPIATTIEDARNFIQKITEIVKHDEGIYWAITLADSDNLIGTICLFNFSSGNIQGEIGYELLPAFQRQGIMQEAMSKVVNYALQVLALKTIEAYTHPENRNSAKLLQKLNFKKQESTDHHHTVVLFKLSAT